VIANRKNTLRMWTVKSFRALGHESERRSERRPDPCGPFDPIRNILSMTSRVHPKYKTKYRVSNWAEYDRALVNGVDGHLVSGGGRCPGATAL
jgi:hypothetical protein